MQFIVLGSVKPGTSRNARLAALATYLKRDTTGTSVQASEEWWASHPDYFMVMEVTANTDAEVWESLAPWREMCDFKVLPVQPMRAAIEANAFAWAPAPVPATYQTGGCQSQTVNGYLTMTHQFGGDTYQVENPNQDYIVPLPNDFLYRLFGQQPRPGVEHPLGIQPLDFFGNPNSPWAKIQLMPNAGSRSR